MLTIKYYKYHCVDLYGIYIYIYCSHRKRHNSHLQGFDIYVLQVHRFFAVVEVAAKYIQYTHMKTHNHVNRLYCFPYPNYKFE